MRFSACFSLKHAFFGRLIMIGERKFILANRIVWFVLCLICFIIPAIYGSISTSKNLKIVSHNGYILEYYESLDTSDCEIVVTFNESVYSGDIVISFYDSSDNLLSTKSVFFSSSDSDDTLSQTVYINGKVDSYEIIDYSDIEIKTNSYLVIEICVPLGIFLFIIFIMSLLLSCKTYEYCGNQIIVYAGWYNHFIKINGTKFDEHNTLVYYTPIKLSCTLDNDTFLETTISLTNRISTKINGKLVQPIKSQKSFV